MNRLDKIKLAISKGITCDINTGKVYGIKGKELKRIGKGYSVIAFVDNGNNYNLFAHQFIYYVATGQVVDVIDHINGNKLDNRICNLRSVDKTINGFNSNSKGYYFHKQSKKWHAQIMIKGRNKSLGLFNTEEEASKAYITKKQNYISWNLQKVN